jgi:hypothetical protein
MPSSAGSSGGSVNNIFSSARQLGADETIKADAFLSGFKSKSAVDFRWNPGQPGHIGRKGK